jgi:hypothetical protein
VQNFWAHKLELSAMGRVCHLDGTEGRRMGAKKKKKSKRK